MPRIGTKDHGTGEAAKGVKAEEGLMWPTDEQSPPVPNVENYGQGDSGRGPQIVTEGDSSRTTPLKGGAKGKE